MRLIVLSVIGLLAAPAAGVQYNTDWVENWRHVRSGDFCRLEIDLQEYGEAGFVASSTSAMGFELQARRDLQQGDLTVIRHAPAWHPTPSADRKLGQLRHIPTGGSVGDNPIAEKMLLALREGFELKLVSGVRVSPPGRLQHHIRAINFFPALDSFLACAHTKTQVAWQHISRTRVAFEVDKHQISEEGLERLDAVIAYVAKDPSIGRLFVDGHTDASGHERANYSLSKRRAEAVAEYLKQSLASSMSPPDIVTRYHGASYPVASNDTAAGKAQNRRTTVRLERDVDRAVAAN